MAFQGHTTIVGPAFFSAVKLSGNQRPYMHIDVLFEGEAKDGGDIGIGFVLTGEQSRKIEDFLGLALEGRVIVSGRISTRTFSRRGKDRACTGLEISTFGVSRPSGEETMFVEGVDFLMFR